LQKELPYISKLFPINQLAINEVFQIQNNYVSDSKLKSDATEFSNAKDAKTEATKFSSRGKAVESSETNEMHIQEMNLNSSCRGNNYHLKAKDDQANDQQTKYYINNPSSLIETAVRSGGVEVINQSSHTIRLSISPSQGDDPGFKSRPEHPLFAYLNPGWICL
jgi:hypothetical protein